MTQQLIEELSERELDLLRSHFEGQTNREIAEVLFISGETVKNHLSAIIGELGVRDRTQAAIFAIRHGGDLISLMA
ncbi:MAG: LuxR C-terminal-related transcriptional regulator [Cyanobacteriota bacterium]|nr:LuxR C-terminal-related transcriptional regulator [Cyanobacteriota bacterium]